MASTGCGVIHPSGLAATAEWARMRGMTYDRAHASYARYNEQGALWLLNERARPRMQLSDFNVNPATLAAVLSACQRSCFSRGVWLAHPTVATDRAALQFPALQLPKG